MDEFESLPEEVKPFVLSILEELERKGIDRMTAWERMKQIANSEYVRKSYGDDLVGLWTYAAEATKAIVKRQTGEAVRVEAVIPIGISPVRTTSQGKRSSVLALIKGDTGWNLEEIVYRGALAHTVDKIELFKWYTDVPLIYRGYFYEATASTVFNSYKEELPDEVVFKELKIRKVTMADMKYALWRMDDQ
jgi:hypothetical protein